MSVLDHEEKFKTDDGLYTLFQEKPVDREANCKQQQNQQEDGDNEQEDKEGSDVTPRQQYLTLSSSGEDRRVNSNGEDTDIEDVFFRDRLETAASNSFLFLDRNGDKDIDSDMGYDLIDDRDETNPLENHQVFPSSASKYFEASTTLESLKTARSESLNSGLRNSASICQVATCAISGGVISTAYAMSANAAISAQPQLKASNVTSVPGKEISFADPSRASFADDSFYCCTCDVEALCTYILTLGCLKFDCLKLSCCDCGESCYCECSGDCCQECSVCI